MNVYAVCITGPKGSKSRSIVVCPAAQISDRVLEKAYLPGSRSEYVLLGTGPGPYASFVTGRRFHTEAQLQAYSAGLRSGEAPPGAPLTDLSWLGAMDALAQADATQARREARYFSQAGV